MKTAETVFTGANALIKPEFTIVKLNGEECSQNALLLRTEKHIETMLSEGAKPLTIAAEVLKRYNVNISARDVATVEKSIVKKSDAKRALRNLLLEP